MNKNHFLIQLSESDRTEFGRVIFAEQSEQQKVFSAIWALESQVNNGGFLQYFVSSDGDTAEFAPKALRAIGALACAEVVDRALRTASPSPLPDADAEREELIDSLPEDVHERMEELDEKFLEYPDNLTDLLFAYVAGHPDAFGPVEGVEEA